MRRIAFAAVLGIAACSEPPSPPPASGGQTPKQPPAELGVLLVKADKADGKEDKVVSGCVTCGLAMDGNPKLASEFEGYSFHLCSERCVEAFEKDPAKGLRGIGIE